MRSLAFIFFTILLAAPSLLKSQEEPEYVPEESSDVVQKERSGVSLPIKGQAEDHSYFVPSYYKGDPNADATSTVDDPENPDQKKKQNNTSINMQVGSSVSSDFKGNSAVTTYVAPHFRHRISSDLSISGGLIMSQTFLSGWTNYSLDGSALPNTIYRTTVYGSLEYQLNEKVLLYGTIYQNLSTGPDVFGFGNGLQGTGFSAGMNYRISDKSFLQIQVQSGRGYNPFNPYNSYNPFMPSPCRYGFGGSPFSYFP